MRRGNAFTGGMVVFDFGTRGAGDGGVAEAQSLRVSEGLEWALHADSAPLLRLTAFPFAPSLFMKRSYRDLFVWQASVDVAVKMIALGDRLIARKRFALADQLVRASCSVPNNIAEGQGRASTRDRRHFLVQARGSLYELETQLEILSRAKLAHDTTDVRGAIAQIEYGLTRMIDRLEDTGRPAPLRL